MTSRDRASYLGRRPAGSDSPLPRSEPPIAIASRYDDPILDEIARSIFTLFPRCVKCGETIARFEEADVRILTHRVVHRAECSPMDEALHPTVQTG